MMARLARLSLVSLWLCVPPSASALLYPRDSETRETKSLDGVWDFRLADPMEPEQERDHKNKTS